jgi:hypothetical protein
VTRILVASLLIVPCLAQPAAAQGRRETVVVVMDGSTLPELLQVPQLESFAAAGGVALMNGRVGVRKSLRESFGPDLDPANGVSFGLWPIVYEDLGSSTPTDAGRAAAELLTESVGTEDPVLLIIISVSPSAVSAADGDELGTVIAAWGDPDELLDAEGEPHALTSDSTRRAGVVADVDPAATVAEWLDLPYDAGVPIERTGEPPPVDLYERYLQQRRLAVPVAAVSWSLMLVFGLAGVLALAFRERLSPRTIGVVETLAASLPWLALGLLLAGHLPSLTVATVVAFLTVVVVAGVAFTRWVAFRRGIFVALAATGAVILAILGAEAAFGWPAAVTPLAGGGQLDGGRFFGMPNIEIGIVLGSALFVVHRVRVVTGALLLAACALVAGSPWTGANFGAAIALFSAAGIWLAVRRRRPWWLVILVTGVVTAMGMAVIALMHRYLTDRPTHVTSFLEDTDGIVGALDRQLERLQVGVDLIVDNPFALVPVLGTLVLLVVVLRPPAAIARSFEGHDAWRDAVLVIVLASIVAYLAEDTGAAAVGFGFGFAVAGLLGVSLAAARGKMTR